MSTSPQPCRGRLRCLFTEKVYELAGEAGEIGIGRALDNVVILPSAMLSVSKKHCVVAWTSAGLFVHDSSQNGECTFCTWLRKFLHLLMFGESGTYLNPPEDTTDIATHPSRIRKHEGRPLQIGDVIGTHVLVLRLRKRNIPTAGQSAVSKAAVLPPPSNFTDRPFRMTGHLKRVSHSPSPGPATSEAR